jgi:hypothetical protein
MAAFEVSIGAEACLARQCLVFGMHLIGDKATKVDYLCDGDIPANVSKDLRRNLRMASIPLRDPVAHELIFEDDPIEIRVVDEGSHDTECRIVRVGAASKAIADRFLDAAIRHCGSLITFPSQASTTRRYYYDSGYWDRLGDAPRRPPESVFLTDEGNAIVREVVEFMTLDKVRDKHRKYGVPWKMNVLLHGPSGTGKTSLIESVAGTMGSDVFIIQFTPKLRDSDLALAMRRVADHPFPIVVMEDVDCIFADRKAHDTSHNAVSLSGFLNALDGMSRPEGSVVFMTTNDASCLDQAVTRSGRVDRVVYMGNAECDQTRNMIEYFFPGLDCSSFVEDIRIREYTTADLHQYLFRCEKHPCAIDFIKGMKRDFTATCASPAMYT